MRPTPSTRHYRALAALLAVLAVNTLLSFRQTNVTGDQANMLAEAFKGRDPSLYVYDGIFGDSGPGALWHARPPAWRWLLAGAVRLVGRDDPLNALRLMGAVAALLYLLFLYVLLYRQTRSTTGAAVVAMLSTAIFSTKRPYWGLGPVFSVTPANLYLAFVPLLVTLFLGACSPRRKGAGGWLVVAVFALLGLLGNLHLSSAVNLAAVLLITLLARQRARPEAWAQAAASVAAAAAAAAPTLLYYDWTVQAAGAAPAAIPMDAVRGVLKLARIDVLFPGAAIQFLWWLPMAAVLAVPAAVILFRGGRYRMREQAVWLWMLAAAVGVALGAQGVSQLVGLLRDRPPPIIEFFAALRLAALPLYVFFAQAAVHLFRQTRRHRTWVRAGLFLFAVVYLGCSFNTRTVRHMVQEAILALGWDGPDGPEQPSPPAPEPPQPPRPWREILRHDLRSGRARELESLAQWARDERHTPRNALFITDREEIRLHARRSILCAADDVRYLFHLAPQELQPWAERFREQQERLRPREGHPASAERIVRFVDEHRPPLVALPIPSYVLLRRETAPAVRR